jgi:oligopeptidase B
MTTPTQIFDYDMESHQCELKKQQEVPCGHNSKDYITRRLFAKTSDNELIPISLLYKNTMLIDGSAPLLLYAYGSYGHSMPASFSTNRLSLVNRGFIYAIAHVRGGMEKGYAWYRNGKLKNKQNTFNDYITCANYLINENFTKKGQIVVHGGSAGGMLVGAVLNIQPELFHAAVADVPFVDVLNTMSDDRLPLTPSEWPEWGNPISSKDDYLNISTYSPYENVSQQAYPHLLVTAGLTDPRVTYWEPAKWVAKLRANKIDDNLLVLKMNMGAGHAGASGRFDYLKEVALMYAFILKVFSMTN